ncbi:hypothetical protein RCJ22_25005 [Vibrio sp. FNV 38]|nr:hypothetical protein [Vibrio sp. FNV 38]
MNSVQPHPASPHNVWKGRATLLALVLFFSIPAIAAYVILSKQWYQPGVTNQGVLIEPRLTYQSLGVDYHPAEPIWQLAFVVPKHCEAACQERVDLLRQSYLALGKYTERVEPVLIMQSNSDPRLAQRFDIPLQHVQQLPDSVADGEDVIIIDPLGQWVMRYSFDLVPSSEQSQLLKGMLKDFKKLLKLSRVG